MQVLSPILNQDHGKQTSFNPGRHNRQSSFITPVNQPRLFTNYPNDIYEQEDATTDKVMRMPLNKNEATFFRPLTISPVQRKCAECEEEEKELQRKEENNSAITDSHELENYRGSLNSKGESLSGKIRNFFEPRFGYDFSNVKVHTDSADAKSAQSINALAYTSGNNIVFGRGQFSPDTDSGKRLLGHELTHVVQQTGKPGLKQNHLLQRQNTTPGTTTPGTTTPGTITTGGTAPQTTSSTVAIASNCNQPDITDIVTQALTWLDDAYQQLLEFDADEAFMGSVPPGPNHARITAALQQSFNTSDSRYAEVIRRRLLHVAQLLRARGRVTINCDRQFCTSAGSSFTAAYVMGPYVLTMCSTGIPGSRPIATFIHEMIHAVIPQVGISNTVTAGTGVTDRAYRDDRVFQHLSPDETLDNADSYGILTELLHARSNTQLVTPQADTTSGCTQPGIVLEAFARASQWHHFALGGLDLDVSLLQGAALSTLNSGNLAMLNRAFPGITTTVQLIALRDAFQSLKQNGFNHDWGLSCGTTRDRNCTASVYSNGGTVSASTVTLRRIRTGDTFIVCPDWFNLSHDDRIRTVYAAFMIGRPSWITTGFRLQNALQYIDGARTMTNEIIPQPQVTGALPHIESDARFRQSRRRTP